MKYIPTAVTRFAGRSMLKVQANSPTLLVVTGVVGFGATAVMAARATRRAEMVFDDHKKGRLMIEETAETKEVQQKATIQLYSRTTMGLVRIYGPTIIVGTASAASILYGHKILQRRHVGAMMAYSGLMEQFASYRGRVAKTLGEEMEKDIFNGAHGEYVEDPNHPGEYKMQSKFDDYSLDGPAEYLRPVFDESNVNWSPDLWHTTFFVKGVQANANQMLMARGHVFLNEVLDWLGMKRVPEGQVLGWVLNGDGDNYIDFGFLASNEPDAIAFREGRGRHVRLNFNVDGPVWDKI
jgi:hypothetical protein